ncbi:MAG: alpha/beta fold hydrolase [Deltaproteobacteria bacterium]|nr:alpha/beta fold hydrolase [Deltaproteobacteria bacterium]
MFHNPQIDPIFRQGVNGAGVLLLHGFTGTPDSMRPVANRLAGKGFTVSVPLLAGHGTTPENLAKTDWTTWFHTAQKAYMELHQRCSKIFVAGLSMGALLALKLAVDYPQSTAAIGCLATPLHLKSKTTKLLPLIRHTPLRHLWKYQPKFSVDVKDPAAKENFWNISLMPLSCIYSMLDLQKLIHGSLPKVQTPILLIHSRHDSTSDYKSMNIVAANVSSSITETVTLENSYHIVTLDFDKELVAQKVTEFFGRFL